MTRLLLALTLLGPSSPEARANEAFAAGDYEAAIEALDQAYAADPDPKYIFAQGSAYQALDRCADAIDAYERFLATDPPADAEAKARDRIQTCRSKLRADETEPVTPVGGDPPAQQDPPESTPAEPAPADERPSDPGPDRPWHRDPGGATLLAVGLATAGAGGALIGVGLSRRQVAPDAGTEMGFREDLQRGNTLQAIGIGLAVSGGAMIIGSIVRYAIVRRRADETAGTPRRWSLGPNATLHF